MKKLCLFILTVFVLTGCYVNVDIPVASQQPLEEQRIGGSGTGKILIIEMNGMLAEDILSNVGGSSTNVNVADIREQLVKASEDPLVKAIILRINSPGGEVTTADVIYHELKTFRKRTQKPIIASIGSMGASGGYYVAIAADQIIANPTAVVGSIGVMMMRFNAKGLLEKIGVRGEVLATGKIKEELGSPFTEMTPESREVLMKILDQHYNRFVQLVSQNRKITVDQVIKLADGKVYSAQQAKDSNLIDKIGYLADAIKSAQQVTDLFNATLIVYRRPGEFNNPIFGKTVPSQVNLLNIETPQALHAPGFLYLWQP